MAADELRSGRPVPDRSIDIADAAGQVLATVAIWDALSGG